MAVATKKSNRNPQNGIAPVSNRWPAEFLKSQKIALDAENTKLERSIHIDRSVIVEKIPGGDECDKALAAAEQDASVALLKKDIETIRMIRDAVAIITKDLESKNRHHYGFCQDCGRAISEKRLFAVPWAVRCTSCEEREENLVRELSIN